jgi:tetratricopeptide (TPR) repeat protein
VDRPTDPSQSRSRLDRWCYLLVLVCLVSGCSTMSTGQNTHGVRLYQKGDYNAALNQFQKAMTTDPNNADSYYNMAATLHRMGTAKKNPAMLQQAETLYNQCLDRNPDHSDCHRGLAVLLVETNRTDRAFTLLKNWAIRSPQNPEPRIEIARLYEEFGDMATAELQLQQAIQLDQNNPRAWAALASLREGNGDYQQAMANYQRAFSLNNYNTAVANRIAALNKATGTATGTTPTQPPGGTRTVHANVPSARY